MKVIEIILIILFSDINYYLWKNVQFFFVQSMHASTRCQFFGSFPFVPHPTPQLSGCILFASPTDARGIFLHNDLLCDDTCSVTGGAHRVLGGTNGKDPPFLKRLWFRSPLHIIMNNWEDLKRLPNLAFKTTVEINYVCWKSIEAMLIRFYKMSKKPKTSQTTL